jgi:hypothetical protein
MAQNRTKASAAEAVPTSAVEQQKSALRQFVRDHKAAGSLFPWHVGKQLDGISNASGTGSGDFTHYMENLGNVKEGGVGVPPGTGWLYLNRFRAAVDLFPQPVIDAMLAINLSPSKQKVIDGARGNRDIVNLLSGIRQMQPSEAVLWSPGVVQQIKQAASRVQGPKIGKQARLTDTICRSFRFLLPQTDPLYKKPAKEPTDEQLKAARNEAYRATLGAVARLQLVKIITSSPTLETLEHEEGLFGPERVI